jgi:hypothetical protein
VIIANFDGVTADVVLERLINSEHENIRYSFAFQTDSSSEANHPIRNIMGRLITGNLDGMIDYIHSLGHSNDISQGQLAFLLRLSVHIILVMRDLEMPHNHDAANEIISQYVYALMQYHVVYPFVVINIRMTMSLSTRITYPINSQLKPMHYS